MTQETLATILGIGRKKTSERISIKPAKKVISKGATIYHFVDGFECTAINAKNAERKHKNFLLINSN